jgi:hypothetical protein
MEHTYYTKKDIVPGAKLPVTVFVMMTEYGTIHFSVFKPTEKDTNILIETQNLVVTVPEDFNITGELVKSIDRQMEIERDKMHVALARLQVRKDELLKISYKGNEILDAE